ncbi:MAG: universal stress protein [Deltaproteobacteria bacterium]|nr:universal stress protein [Deltaproteobacteria bacterium]
MKTRILVALDDSENAFRAVEFISRTFTHDHEITLFSVLQDMTALYEHYSPELTPYFLTQRDAFTSIDDKKKDLIKEAAERAKDLLLKAGFEEKNIILKIEQQKKGIARDIINEANSGYDAIVMGRRGLSSFTGFILGSVSQKVLNSAKNISIMVVD